MSEEKRLLRTIRLRNLLSFGPNSEEIELKSLNVLVGPNGVGQKLRIFRNCQISCVGLENPRSDRKNGAI